MKFIIYVVAFVASMPILGQTLKEFSIVQDGIELTYPFAGGFIAPQFAEFDLDQDGIEDLVVFDRSGNVFRCFLRDQAANLHYSTHYSNQWPETNGWVRLADADGDGIKDLFRFSADQIAASVQLFSISIDNDSLQFDLLSVAESERDPNVLYFSTGNITSPIFVSSIDLPSVTDVDYDGDADIVTFDVNGSVLYWYESLYAQNGDPTEYVLKDDCFGGIFESGFSQQLFLASDINSCANQEQIDRGLEIRHSGSTVSLVDFNSDSLYDVFLGDISSINVAYLENNGRLDDAYYNTEEGQFPANNPTEINVFNAAFAINTDSDSNREIIIAPNERAGIQTTNHIMHFDNESSNGESRTLTTSNFMVEDMLDFGKDSRPCIIDINGDGLNDLLVGSAGKVDISANRTGSLWYLQNTGQGFEVITDNYLNFNRFHSQSFRFSPTAGDIDGDGDIDLIIGDDRGYLYYVQNNAGMANPVDFVEPEYQYFGIRPGINVNPVIYDANGDGLTDIIIGERNYNSENGERGALNYFENKGSVGNPQFSDQPETQVFGKIFNPEMGFIRNNAAPAFIALENGEYLTVTGTVNGHLRYYKGNDPNATFEEIFYKYNVTEGENATPVFGDLDGDGILELVIGNNRGGLAIYDSPFLQNGTVDADDIPSVDYHVSFDSNPFSNQLGIQLESDKIFKIEIFDTAGRTLYTNNRVQHSLSVDASSWSSGIIFLRIRDVNSKSAAQTLKIVKS